MPRENACKRFALTLTLYHIIGILANKLTPVLQFLATKARFSFKIQNGAPKQSVRRLLFIFD